MSGSDSSPVSSDPRVRAAYEALLGDYFDGTLVEQAQLNAVVQTVAPTRDAAVEFLFRAFQEQAREAPHSWQPTLVTDRGSALIDVNTWRAGGGASIGPKMGSFVSDIGASFAVLGSANSTSRKLEAFQAYGTDGITTRTFVAVIEYRLRGRRIHVSTDHEMDADPQSFLGPIILALRNNASRSSEVATSPSPHESADEIQAAAPQEPDRSLDVLRERYARGDISREEFLQIKDDLGIE